MPNIESDSIIAIGEKIRKKVGKKIYEDVSVTVSIGCYDSKIGSNVEESLNALIKKADACLYKAKGTGRNKVVCAL